MKNEIYLIFYLVYLVNLVKNKSMSSAKSAFICENLRAEKFVQK